MHLRKYHGLGNDFLVILDVDGKQPVDADLARAVCDRHTGVGADGLIRLTGDLRMELYNADGGRAETSGNGLRCVALAAADAGWDVGRSFTITTDAGPRRIELHDDGLVSVEMGTARIDGRRVDMGNPHRVVFADADEIESPDFGHENVEFVWRDERPDVLRMRVFERGVGETMACGTGACAAAAVAHAEGLVGDRVVVEQPGGHVVVQLGDPIVLTGPAAYICDVEYPWP